MCIRDRGKEGKVIRTLKSEQRVVVEGVNIVKKHSKPRTTNESGDVYKRQVLMFMLLLKEL